MPDRILLDTHALVWWQAGSDRLSRPALSRIESAEEVLISPITCWEVTMLVIRGRIGLDRPVQTWVDDVLAGERVGTAALTPTIAVTAGILADFHGDPADRLIYATAAVSNLPLVTKDRQLVETAARSRSVATIW